MDVCVYIYTYIYMNVYMFIHICMNAYILIYMCVGWGGGVGGWVSWVGGGGVGGGIHTCKKINRSHTHTHRQRTTPPTPTHTRTRQEQHPKPPNEHLPQTLNNARRWRDEFAYINITRRRRWRSAQTCPRRPPAQGRSR